MLQTAPTTTPSDGPPARAASWSEVLGVYLFSLGCVALALLVGQGPLKEYRGGFIGAIYLSLPTLLCRRWNLPVEEYAPLERPTLRAILAALLFALLFFPLFWVVGSWLGLVAPYRTFVLPERFGLLVLTQFLVVAVPEELFFRGYLQRRLDDLVPPKFKLFGVFIGPSLLLAAVGFALAHFISPPSAARLLTFFPGLAFGFLRSATKGIWAGAIFHGLCNVYLEMIVASTQ
jgi:membrane protease YdiL (CAAX protease family)